MQLFSSPNDTKETIELTQALWCPVVCGEQGGVSVQPSCEEITLIK